MKTNTATIKTSQTHILEGGRILAVHSSVILRTFCAALATVAILLALVLVPAPLSQATPVIPLAEGDCRGVHFVGDAVCETTSLRVTGVTTISGSVTPGLDLNINLSQISNGDIVTFDGYTAAGDAGSGTSYVNVNSDNAKVAFSGTNTIVSSDGNQNSISTSTATCDFDFLGSGSANIKGFSTLCPTINIDGPSIVSTGTFLSYGSIINLVSGSITAPTISSSGGLSIGSGTTVNGNISASGTVTNEGTVNGNITTYGGNVINNGEITGNVNAGAGDITNRGTINGSVTTTGTLDNTGTITGLALAAPTNIHVTVNSYWDFTATWDAVPGAAGYAFKMVVNDSICDTSEFYLYAGTEPSFNFDDLNCGTDDLITLYVAALSAVGTESLYDEIDDTGLLGTAESTTFHQDKTISAGEAQNITHLYIDSTSARISWEAPASLGTPAANTYSAYLTPYVGDSVLCGTVSGAGAYAEPGSNIRSFVCDGVLVDGEDYTVGIYVDYIDPNNPNHHVDGDFNSYDFTFDGDNDGDNATEVDPCSIDEDSAECTSLTEPDAGLGDVVPTPEEECVNDGGTWDTDHCVPPAPATTPCPTGTTGTSVEADDCVPNAATTPTSHGDVPLSDALKALGAYIDENGTIHVPTGEAIPLTVIHDTEGDITTEFTFVSTSSVEYTAYDIIDNDAKTITFTHASPHSVAGTAANRADVAFVFEVFDSPKLGQTGVSNTTILNYALLLLIAGLGVSFTRRKFGA